MTGTINSEVKGELIEPAADRALSEFDSTPAAVHNFDGTPMEQWKLLAFATGPSCAEGREILGQRFPLKYWYVHQVELVREDGEVITSPRVVLFDNAGNAWGFVSGGIYQSLKTLVQVMGRGPYDPPLNCIVREGKSSAKRTFYFLEPAPERVSTGGDKK